MHYKLRSTAVVQCGTPSPSIQIHLQRVQRGPKKRLGRSESSKGQIGKICKISETAI